MRFLPALSTLQLALGISVAVHAALLTIRFVNPEAFNRVFKDTPLEVILVNARSEERPELAQAIAQARLAGGGEAARGRATSPLPPSAEMRIAEQMEEEAQQRRVEELKEQQNRMLAQIRQQLANYSIENPLVLQTPQELDEREQKRRALVKVLGEIEKRINEENARPKKRFLGPSTREAVFAVYHDGLRRRIEDRGTANFPEMAGRKLHGELTMVITVNHDGRVIDTEVVESSGQSMLDRRAEAIVKSMTYGRFTSAMRAQADQIVVVWRFRFTRDATLQTQMSR